MYKYLLLLVFALHFFNVAFAQQRVSGRLLDAKSKEPVSFAALVDIINPVYGTMSDINGYFNFKVSTHNSIVRIKHMSYESIQIPVADLSQFSTLELTPSSFKINEVFVKAKENPAHRLIRMADKNKRLNNPDNIPFYACEIYHKTYMEIAIADSLLKYKKYRRMKQKLDSMYMFLMETHSLKNYEKGKGAKEKVNAIKVAGFKKPDFFVGNTEIQPFHFYDNYAKINEKQFLNPINSESLTKYYYEITDTLISNTDTVFTIYFRPMKNKAFDGLQGQLQIHTNGYAIYSIIAEPAGKHLHQISIKQQSTFYKGKWVPVEVSYDLKIPYLFAGPGSQMIMSGRSKMKNYRYAKNDLADFNIDNLAYEFVPKAWEVDTAYFANYRIDSLTFRDRNSYKTIDSISEEINLEKKLEKFASLASDYHWPFKYVSFNLRQLLTYNLYEKFGVGLALRTNDDVSKWMSVGGYFRYGTEDAAYKYGGDLKIKLNEKRKFYVDFGYKNDLKEPAVNDFGLSHLNLFSRTMLMSRADSVVEFYGKIQRQFGKFAVKLEYCQQEIKPMYNYGFHDVANGESFNNNQVGVSLSYKPNEKTTLFYGKPLAIPALPEFNISLYKGFDFNGGYAFDKILFSSDFEVPLTALGRSRFLIKGGWVNGEVPLFGLIEGQGSFEKDLPFVFTGYFQTMPTGEFINDKFAAFFYSHSFGPIFKLGKKFSPSLIVVSNAGYGEISKAYNRNATRVTSMDKGYFESGMILNEVLELKYLDLFYWGFGAGVFYKYGPYADVKQLDNFAYKLSLTFNW